ncbi:MAG: hypothetical protein DDT41_01556 [candidate division WS2 bacterium]|nr:hypothetical protein [Candidatus Psychracetigena formicireducens]
MRDLTKKDFQHLPAKEKIIPADIPLGERRGGIRMHSTSFKRGSGTEVFGSDAKGIWLGSADFENAPFRTNMRGALTCSGATIRGALNASDLVSGILTGRNIQTNIEINRGIKILTSPRVAGAPFGLMEFWTNLGDASLLYIDSSANFNIEGGDLVVQANIWTPTLGATLGTSTRKWHSIFRTNEFACDLPTTENACDIFKKIKDPTEKISKKRKHFGERPYFKIEDFPIEMKANSAEKGKPEKLDIEMTRTLGVAVKAIRELISRVEKLELKIDNRIKK